MSGPELDREFKELLVAIRPLLPLLPQGVLANVVRWLQKLSSCPAAERCQRNEYLRLLHSQLGCGQISAPFDVDPPLEPLPPPPTSTATRQQAQPAGDASADESQSSPAASTNESAARAPSNEARALLGKARALLRGASRADSLRAPALPSNDEEWSDVTTSDGESCASGDFALTLVTGTGHERCILLHRKHLAQLATQGGKIRRYEAALKHFLENPSLLLGDQETEARDGELAASKKQLSEAERAKSESQRLAREAAAQLQACQQHMKADSESCAAQLAALNGKLQAYQLQMRSDGESSARQLAALNAELKTSQLRLRSDADNFRAQLASLKREMHAAAEESKRQLAAKDKKTRLQLSALREEMTQETDCKLEAAKHKVARLHRVIRRYDELKQRWSEEFEKKIHQLEIEKDLQMAKVRLEVQTERASCLLAGTGEQMVTQLEAKYQALAREHEEASWRQRQRDLRRISKLERELEARQTKAQT